MFDRKQVTYIIIGTVVILAVIAGFIIWLVTANNNKTSPEVSPTPSIEVEETPTVAFTEEQQQTVFKVATVAAAWSGPENPDITKRRYAEAGMSERLVRTYTPVWAEYFGSNESSAIRVKSVGSEPSSIEYEPGRLEGTGLFRVGVEVNYEGNYHTGKTTATIPDRTNTWYFILDERSGEVTSIEQPSLADIDLPAPKKD